MNSDDVPTLATSGPGVEIPAPALQRLYTVRQVVIATALGSPMAGAHLLARNERELGHPAAVKKLLAIGVLLTIALFVLPSFLPGKLGEKGFAFLGVICTGQYARQSQGAAIAAHLQAGGVFRSWWSAMGVGLAYLFAVLTVVMFYVWWTTA